MFCPDFQKPYLYGVSILVLLEGVPKSRIAMVMSNISIVSILVLLEGVPKLYQRLRHHRQYFVSILVLLEGVPK